MITGWWWLAQHANGGSVYSSIIAVGENEIAQYRRVFLLY